jgi:hypothetical protein
MSLAAREFLRRLDAGEINPTALPKNEHLWRLLEQRRGVRDWPASCIKLIMLQHLDRRWEEVAGV